MASEPKKVEKRYATRDSVERAFLGEGRARLARFVRRHKRGEPQDPADLAEIAAAFEQILKHADPKKALGISGKQGQGRREKTAAQVDEQEIAPVLDVRRLMAAKMLKNAAIEQVAAERGINPDTLEEVYYDKHWRFADWCLALEAESRATEKRYLEWADRRAKKGGKKTG